MSKNEPKKAPGAPKGNNNAQKGDQALEVRLPLRITQGQSDKLDRYVEKHGGNRAEAARALLDQGQV